jgi:tetratricopeptide (TPR) repeat protein
MRIKAIIALFALTSTVAMAQKGVEDGSRFGHGQDSIDSLNNLSLNGEHVKTKNYAEAYPYWQKVFADAPISQHSIYTNGVAILKNLIAGTKDMAQRKSYADELMKVYDQQLQYLDKLNLLRKSPWTDFYVKGEKAHTYITYYPGMDTNKAYEMLTEAIELGKAKNQYYIIGDFMKISTQKFKTDDTHREQLVQDYLTASELINVIAEAANKSTSSQKEALLKAVATTKENVDAYFINSGAADCSQLEAIYAPKVEENKENLEYLKKVVAIMGMLSCTESETYYNASEYAHHIAPTAATAAGCAYRYLKRGEIAKSIEYFDQAIELDTVATSKAEYCYKAAVVLNSDRQLSKAKGYVTRAISLNGNKGAYHILLANIYAAAPKWNDEPLLDKCKYFVVLDRLYQAKRVDESVTEEANKMISAYSTHTPSITDLFMIGKKEGDKVHVGGLINETTTIR